jgi:hypothetical protein
VAVELGHAAHAIATFSEIGIGLGVATIADLPKWRYRVETDGDSVKRAGVEAAAREAGWVYLVAVLLVTKLRSVVWYVVPAIALVTGYLALHALVHPESCWVGRFPYFGDVGEKSFVFSLVSFWCSVSSSILMAVTARSYDKSRSAEKSPVDPDQ